MDGDWSWWMLLGWTWMAVFWGLVVVGAVMLFQRAGRGEAAPREDDALTILERRYARGELGGQEFDEMRRTLRGR